MNPTLFEETRKKTKEFMAKKGTTSIALATTGVMQVFKRLMNGAKDRTKEHLSALKSWHVRAVVKKVGHVCAVMMTPIRKGGVLRQQQHFSNLFNLASDNDGRLLSAEEIEVIVEYYCVHQLDWTWNGFWKTESWYRDIVELRISVAAAWMMAADAYLEDAMLPTTI